MLNLALTDAVLLKILHTYGEMCMSESAVKRRQGIGLVLDDKPTPPQIIREDMAVTESCHIGTPSLIDAFTHWCALKGDLPHPPQWSAFKPFNHPEMLPHIALYQRVGDRYRCSILGEVAIEHLPIKLAGCFLDEVVPPTNLSDMLYRFNRALDTGCPNFVEKSMAWQPGYDLKSYRSLQLPFIEGETRGGRILSVMDFRVESI